jgi:hypothetical protein
MLRRILFFLTMVFCPLAALAAAPYEVRQVAVEVPVAEDGSSNPAASRQQGLDMAADQGLRQLLKLITPEDSWSKQDEMLKKTPAKTLLERFNIVQETSRLPYKLVVDLYFKREALRKVLAENGVPFVDTKQESVLVVPVYIVGENAQLFEQDNPWGGAVQVALEGPHLARFQLPAGDYDDMMTLTPQMAILGVAESIQALGQRHKADMVLVSTARVNYRDGRRVLQVQSNWFGATQRTPVNFEVPLPEGDATKALEDAARKLVQGVEGQWRSSRNVAVNKPQSLVAFLNVTHVAGLEKTLKDLNGMASVQQAFLRSLTKREAYIQIDYYGESDDLAENLRRNNLVLTNQEGRWLLNPGRSLPSFSGQTEAPQAVDAVLQGSATDAAEGSVEE